MESPARPRAAGSATIALKPLDEEVDTFGLTHPGKEESVNQDHFLICTVRRDLYVHGTSLLDGTRFPHGGQRRAMIGMIADGFGRGSWGEEASRVATEVVAQYLVHNIGSYHMAEESAERAFLRALQELVVQVNANIEQKAREHSFASGMQSELILWVGIWPRAYLLQMGSSRCYVLRKGKLFRLPEDVINDANPAMTVAGAPGLPTVTRLDQLWGDVGLLCSKGLTNHVSDAKICERLSAITSAKQVCEDLLQDALEGGGSDNITAIVGRIRPDLLEALAAKKTSD